MSVPQKLLVTGANGFVAGHVLLQAGAWEIHAVSRQRPPAARSGWHWHSLDSLAVSEWADLFRQIKPAAVIHTAAIADIDFAEANPTTATAVNVGLTRTLVELCRSSGARLVHCSTDTVFDGEHAPYREDDLPKAINHYAHTKIEAEHLVRDLGEQAVIARLAVVYGLPVLGAGNSFLTRMLASLQAGKEITAPEREIRTPVDVITLAAALLEFSENSRLHGTFHLAGNERFNRLDLARRIAAFYGFPPERITGIDPGTLPGRAPRPRDVSLDNSRARSLLKTPMVDLDTGLSSIRRLSQTSPQ